MSRPGVLLPYKDEEFLIKCGMEFLAHYHGIGRLIYSVVGICVVVPGVRAHVVL